MHSWNGQTNWEHDALARIAALLFALAGLAELAGAVPAPRRLLVLGILGRGEAAARAFLMAPDALFRDAAAAREDAPDPAGVAAGDALLLAARLRTLALMFAALAARVALSERRGASAGRRALARQAFHQAASPAPDTS
jgi:hypothetical protein